MNEHQKSVAKACLLAAEENAMTFPEIIGQLMAAGFEGYAIDFRRATATYYLTSGESTELATHKTGVSVAAAFDARQLQTAIKEAQTLAPGYTYKSFCKKASAAGCAGYVVSFSGRRALYVGRTAETHVEQFPS
jgi:uncharacterized protein YbcV (DUF1398 family)